MRRNPPKIKKKIPDGDIITTFIPKISNIEPP